MTIPDDLRIRLHYLADDAVPLHGEATAQRAVDRARTQRRTRATVLGAVAATVLIAVGVPAALGAMTDSPAPHIAAPAGSSSASPTAVPTAAGRTQQIAPGLTVQIGPAEAAVGTAYPFDVYTHCGFRSVTFAGRLWQASLLHPRAAAPHAASRWNRYVQRLHVRRHDAGAAGPAAVHRHRSRHGVPRRADRLRAAGVADRHPGLCD